MLYFNILSAIKNLEKPSTFTTDIKRNIIINPLLAPFISAELKEICDEIHIAKNKNSIKYGLAKFLVEKIVFIKSI